MRRLRIAVASDAEYLRAVESGDLSAAGRMVQESAHAKGYNIGPVYHGTKDKFSSFKQMKGKTTVLFSVFDVDRHGFFFTLDKSAASSYGKNILSVYISANNVADLNDTSHELFISLFKKIEPFGIDLKWYQNPGEFGHTWEMFDGEEGKLFVNALIKSGFDSANFEDQNPETSEEFNCYCVFSPYQIKLSDPVTKDDSGKVIPLSLRFNKNSQDIRY